MGDVRGTTWLVAVRALSLLLIVTGPLTEDVWALPRNPERPLRETTCAQATARYHEALSGSSLVSRQRNAELAEQARLAMIRLCGEDK
ncbi:hypothetical protein HGO38_19595 [Rhizobium sp. CG5]|uniref:hypothetical protein n=1 Tax=Rhizobium sp. CG5 TaxID=2726076 RepID=UPI0020346BE1|nr:hypothetical protein [Rhizobium sp. CG5]MCM2475683.1 hypothetical protein [Rhizobium sp. CG5]